MAFSVGCFEVTPLSSARWRVMNAHTKCEHVTYGTEQEVREQLEAQTEAWDRKLAPRTKDNLRVSRSPWKTQNTADVLRQKVKSPER